MSAPVSFIECVSKMAYTRVLSCVMLALISSIIASIQLNLAIIDVQENDLDADVRAKREDPGPDQVVQAPSGTILPIKW